MSGDGNLAEFRELLDMYGSRPEGWPADRREEMLRLCAENPRARALLAEAKALDAVLRETVVPPAAPDLAARLLQRAATTPQMRHAGATARKTAPQSAANDNRPVMRWLAAGWLAASLLIGIWLGLSGRIIVPPSLIGGSDTVADAGTGDALADLLGIVSSVEDGGETL